jgi:hypothetical protein
MKRTEKLLQKKKAPERKAEDSLLRLLPERRKAETETGV